MATHSTYLHSQLITTHANTLILPNIAVAEIVNYSEPESVTNAPEWLIGMVQWRGLKIPLISFERAAGQSAPNPSAKNRIAVLNALGGDGSLHYFAIVTKGLPRLVNVERKGIVATESSEAEKFVLAKVVVNEIPAVIPDLDAVEEMIKTQGIKVTKIH